MLRGETMLSLEKTMAHCDECDKDLPFRVCQSAAGYYIGTWCDHCGPYSRESLRYWKTEEEAQEALDSGKWAAR